MRACASPRIKKTSQIPFLIGVCFASRFNSWCSYKHTLAGEMMSLMPVIHFVPIPDYQEPKEDYQVQASSAVDHLPALVPLALRAALLFLRRRSAHSSRQRRYHLACHVPRVFGKVSFLRSSVSM
jgi:hypothetical protein